jgi:polyisoprenyl-teichoic acid--peptidoglycan teichoic acid transferase
MTRSPLTSRRLGLIGLAAVVTGTLTVGPVLAATKTTTKASSKTSSKTTSKTSGSKTTTKSKTASKVMREPNGRAPKVAGPFLWDVASPDAALPGEKSFEAATTKIVPGNKLYKLLIVGSDAREGQPISRTRADSIHLLIWNPAFNKGILVGFPRDSIVPTATGERKLTETLSTGGPTALVDAISRLSGSKIDNYVITGFGGFTTMVDQIGGVNVLVDPAMNDPYSGATFKKGWFAMNGQAALAFARNRKGVANGDFTRSYNQGSLLLYTLAKMREEVSDAPGLIKWIKVLQANSESNLKPTDMLVLSQIARSIDPIDMQNVVLAGKNVKLGKGKKAQDAIRLNPGYAGFFVDVNRDGVNDGR